MIRNEFEDLAMCLSTNGTLLENNVRRLEELNVATITVSMSTSSVLSASRIYEWGRFQGKTLYGKVMASRIVESQMRGITKASSAGIRVKVNSILIPEINRQDIEPLAQEIAAAGASLQNIVSSYQMIHFLFLEFRQNWNCCKFGRKLLSSYDNSLSANNVEAMSLVFQDAIESSSV